MRNIEELTKLVLENDEVPEPKVVTVVPTVRTNADFPPPSWLGRPKRKKETETSSGDQS